MTNESLISWLSPLRWSHFSICSAVGVKTNGVRNIYKHTEIQWLRLGVRPLVGLGRAVIGMQAGVDAWKEVRGWLLELLKSIGCSPRAHWLHSQWAGCCVLQVPLHCELQTWARMTNTVHKMMFDVHHFKEQRLAGPCSDLTHLLLSPFPSRSEGSFTPMLDSWLFQKALVVD